MEFRAWFQCINGCPGQYELTEIIYKCPECDELLEVQHDTKALQSRSGQDWRDLFEGRYRRHDWPYGSSVWGKKETCLPEFEK